MSRYEEIETFVRVVDAGSITTAAEQMHIAKSAVSRRLKELEARLGVQLLQRSSRKQILTNTGQALYQRAVTLLADWAEAEAAASMARIELAGKLRLSAPLSFGIAHLSPAIIEFMKMHPDVDLDVDFTDRFVDLIEEGFDLAVRIGQLAESSLIAKKLATISTVVVASPEYLQRNGIPEKPEDLVHHKECVYGHRRISSWRYTKPDGSEEKVELKPRMFTTNGEFLRDVVLAGEGVLKIPRFIVYKNLQEGSLTEILSDYGWDELPMHVVYPPTRHLSSRVRAFVDFLDDRFKGTPYWEQ